MRPPARAPASKIVTLARSPSNWYAASNPAAPAPMTATFLAAHVRVRDRAVIGTKIRCMIVEDVDKRRGRLRGGHRSDAHRFRLDEKRHLLQHPRDEVIDPLHPDIGTSVSDPQPPRRFRSFSSFSLQSDGSPDHGQPQIEQSNSASRNGLSAYTFECFRRPRKTTGRDPSQTLEFQGTACLHHPQIPCT